MSESITVNVTKDDISNGCCASPSRCPIVLALKRIKPAEWTVGERLISLDGKPFCHQSDRVMKWRMNFDDGKRVKPFSFKITKE